VKIYSSRPKCTQPWKSSRIRAEGWRWCTYHDRVEECLDPTLKSLQTDYIDLYLIHWPIRTIENGTAKLTPTKLDGSRNIDWKWKHADTWKQMEAVLAKSKVKAIGVSQILLEELEEAWKTVPAVNQVSMKLRLRLFGLVFDLYRRLRSTRITRRSRSRTTATQKVYWSRHTPLSALPVSVYAVSLPPHSGRLRPLTRRAAQTRACTPTRIPRRLPRSMACPFRPSYSRGWSIKASSCFQNL
jgi:hypothetical protein